ncbi:23S rRNA (uracil(1939)-C(5))-methyltransferase RlmD [Cohnella sp. JJ-181]|uniref:23S rRNA (uracil(1939)-C(5))-methyltransferase RlmD n=1 Tax=Cohnella rhizoplanae TaxID=2974897 RepID=UPI0022FFB51B|nr:23S rRNA (uracil(1939)-C(5))-methyltransferase RlmD [Cohnella sp. JJ-181]CAI6079569.1 23S rRNA (uracil-C(5))-methyltransferase RlmCD [Cohnella sp. JJ-181]
MSDKDKRGSSGERSGVRDKVRRGGSRSGAADRGGKPGGRGAAAGAGGGRPQGQPQQARGARDRRQGEAPRQIAGVPVAVGDSVVIDIVGMTHEGQGVGRVEGYALFVSGAVPGDRVQAEVQSIGKSFGRARMAALVAASPDRIAAPCAIYEACGGCQLQHWGYAAQLRWKREHVAGVLARIGKLPVAPLEEAAAGEAGGQSGGAAAGAGGSRSVDAGRSGVRESAPAAGRAPVVVHPVIGMDEPWRYRNKAQVPMAAGIGGHGLIGGFFEQGSHQVVDMEACLIQQEQNEETVRAVKRIARSLGYAAYDRATGRGLLRHVVVRHAEATGQRMVVLITNGRDLPHADELTGLIREDIPGVASICQNINTGTTSQIFGEETRVLWGNDVIYDEIGGISFAISARSFFQVNPTQTERLYRTAVDYAGLTGEETVIDAYCGIGTITLFLARHARRVYGVEIIPEAIEDARRNALLNHIANAEFAVGPAEVVMPQWQAEGVAPDVIVVDPPRKGCDPALLATMLELRPTRIVYVSCDPATLARDLRVLEDGGYRTVEVQPVDMFPHTTHVECVALLVQDRTEAGMR